MSQKRQIYSLLIAILFMMTLTVSSVSSVYSLAQKKQVTLTAILSDDGRWDGMMAAAKQTLTQRHPGMDIQIQYQVLPYDKIRPQMLRELSNRTPVDLISVDQIWLGEFAGKRLLSDLTNQTQSWGRSSDWYPVNWEGGKYNDKVYNKSSKETSKSRV